MRIESICQEARPCGATSPTQKEVPSTPFAQVLRPEVRTPLSEEAAFLQLEEAWSQVTGQAPNPKTTSILWAQWAMETARGKKMYGHNFSGIKGTGPSGLSLMLRTTEGYGPTREVLRDRFRAYVSPAEGATDYVRLLRDRYPQALQAAADGDAKGFVREIRRRGYFTDHEQTYARAISSLSKEAMTRGGSVSQEEAMKRTEAIPAVSAATTAVAIEALWWASRRWSSAT